MSYPWTDRHSFVADWSKQGEGEDSSQQGLAALLGLVTNSTAVLFLATPAAGLPVSLLPHCCHCAVTPLLLGWATGCSEGARVLQQSTGQRMLGSGCQRDPIPQTGHLQVFPDSSMATCSLPPPRHSLSATGWSQPANVAAEGVSPHPLTFGYHPACSGGKEGCCRRRGKEGRTDALLAITSTPSYHHSNLMIKNNPRLERKHV